MKNAVDSVLKTLTEFFKKLSRKDKIRLAVLCVVIIGLSITVASVLGRTTYGTLYTGLDAATAGEIITELDVMGVPYKTEGSNTILIPAEQVTTVRMQLASLGYLSSGFTYELFSMADGFGKTDYEKQTVLLYQTESHVQQQLMTMDKIENALVMINLPKTSSFTIKSDEVATATVTLKIKSGAALTESEVEAIAHVVSGGTSVPVENVYIVDTDARLYIVGEGNSSTSATALSTQLDLQERVRNQFEAQIINLLTSVFGSGRVRVSASVQLNFDTETVQSVEFAPPVEDMTEGLVISMTELYEYTRDETAEGVVGTDTNGVGTPEYPYDNTEGYDYYHIAREFNYEINETVTQLEKAQATIRDLTISVLVDSEAITEDYTETVRDLVVNAIGVNENYVTVARLPFQASAFDSELSAKAEMIKHEQNLELLQFIIKCVIILVLAFAVFSLVRMVIRGIFPPPEPPALAPAGIAVDSIGENVDYMVEDNPDELPYEEFFDSMPEPESDVDLNVKPDTVVQLEKFIDKDSGSVAQLLRNWLTDDE